MIFRARCLAPVPLLAALFVAVSLPARMVRADLDPKAQMLLGNPDRAEEQSMDNPVAPARYLIRRPQYALSYNEYLHISNWVAWHLNASDIGTAERGGFVPDPALPPAFYRVVTSDYTRSGYDRGHNCPSKDRSATRADNDAVFYLTNITPQAHGMNAGPWEQFEGYCRGLAQGGNELYVLCGHGFSATTHGSIGTRGGAKIAVPDFAWKIVVVLPDRSGNDLTRITARTRVIAVRMPNVSTISKRPWRDFVTTPKAIEAATGLHFFGALPPTIADALRKKKDAGIAVVGR